MSTYRDLVRATTPGYLVLAFLARLPLAMAPLATLVLVVASTGSYAVAGLANAVQGLASMVGGPVLGALADRHGHRTVTVAATAVAAAALAGLVPAARAGTGAVLAASALAGLARPQIGALVRVQWSRLARAHDRALLPTALSYEAAVDETTFVAGPALVGILTLIPVAGAAPVAAAAILLLAATLPFALVHTSSTTAPSAEPDTALPGLPRPELAGMFAAMAIMGVVFGAVQTAVTAFANTTGRPWAAGLIYAELGVGSALAGTATAWLPRNFTVPARYACSAGALLLGTLLLLTVGSLATMLAAVAVLSVTVAPYMITLYGLTDQLAPASRANAAMTVMTAGGPAGVALGTAVAGHLADHHGYRGAFAVAPPAAAAALTLALASLRRLRGLGGGTGEVPIYR
ncbi:MAG: hypothetical protein V7603_2315 [Micromonosporaceae bacterium]